MSEGLVYPGNMLFLIVILLFSTQEYNAKHVGIGEFRFGRQYHLEGVYGLCPSLKIGIKNSHWEKKLNDDFGISIQKIADSLLLENHQDRANLLYDNEIYRAYLMALFGTVQTFAMSTCHFVSGDVEMDLRVPFSAALTSSMTNLHVINGTLKVHLHYGLEGLGLMFLPKLSQVLNRNKEEYNIKFTFYHKPNFLKDYILEFIRLSQAGLKISIDDALLINSGLHIYRNNFTITLGKTTGMQFAWNEHKGWQPTSVELAKNNCPNGALSEEGGGNVKCCPEYCENGCFWFNGQIACLECVKGEYYNYKTMGCVACANHRKMGRFCLEEARCPAPLVDTGNYTCSFTCNAGHSITASLDKRISNEDVDIFCKGCDHSFEKSDNDFTVPKKGSCARSCSHFGLLTMFNYLEDCQVLMGNIIINQWSLGQRTNTRMHQLFIEFFDKFDGVYGNLIIHDLLNTVTFNYLSKLRRVEGTLKFINNDILTHVSLNSILPKGIKNLHFERNYQFNIESRVKFFERISRKHVYKFNMRPTPYQPYKDKVEELYRFFHDNYPSLDGATCPNDKSFLVVTKDNAKCEKEKPANERHCSTTCGDCGTAGDLTSWKCQKCKNFKIDQFNLKTCVGDQCPFGYYGSGTGDDKVCNRCHRNCLTCGGPDQTFGGQGCSRCQILYGVNATVSCFPYIPQSAIEPSLDPLPSVFGFNMLLPFNSSYLKSDF